MIPVLMEAVMAMEELQQIPVEDPEQDFLVMVMDTMEPILQLDMEAMPGTPILLFREGMDIALVVLVEQGPALMSPFILAVEVVDILAVQADLNGVAAAAADPGQTLAGLILLQAITMHKDRSSYNILEI